MFLLQVSIVFYALIFARVEQRENVCATLVTEWMSASLQTWKMERNLPWGPVNCWIAFTKVHACLYTFTLSTSTFSI